MRICVPDMSGGIVVSNSLMIAINLEVLILPIVPPTFYCSRHEKDVNDAARWQ